MNKQHVCEALDLTLLCYYSGRNNVRPSVMTGQIRVTTGQKSL